MVWLFVAGMSALGAFLGFALAIVIVSVEAQRSTGAPPLVLWWETNPPLPWPFVEAARGWIEGVPRGQPSRTSPISGVPCFVYRVEVEELQPNAARQEALRNAKYERHNYRTSDDPSRRTRVLTAESARRVRDAGPAKWWVPLFSETHAEPFLLETRAGSVRVDVDSQTELDVTFERELNHGFFSRIPSDVSARLEELGIARRTVSSPRRLRVRERRLESGEVCTVVGRLQTATVSNGYRDTATQWSLVGNGDWLVVCDRSRARATHSKRHPAPKILWLLPIVSAVALGGGAALIAILARA